MQVGPAMDFHPEVLPATDRASKALHVRVAANNPIAQYCQYPPCGQASFAPETKEMLAPDAP